MKIHMDYLENKLELFQGQMQAWDKEKTKLERQYETAKDKLSLVRESKDREIKDLNKKITDISMKLKSQVQKSNEFERKLNQERDSYN